MMMSHYKAIVDALVRSDLAEVVELVKESLEKGDAAADILNQGLIAGMDIVGEKMENQEMFIPEVLMAAKAMSESVDILKPLLAEEGISANIGKNLVAMMCESAGFEVFNAGVDIEPDVFVSEVKGKKANILMLSALLTTTMPMMKATIEAINQAGLRDQVKILVGGAPVSQKFADEIGADGYAPDAGSAAKMAKSFFS
jgi:5-methyltetrahydrofolate--homocysteine methyltransferase